MMDILNTAFGIHEQALKVRSQRMEVLARNIANADTPNFKAQDLDFKAMLKEVKKDYLTATHSKHYAACLTIHAVSGNSTGSSPLTRLSVSSFAALSCSCSIL